jgi:hypothetical protein
VVWRLSSRAAGSGRQAVVVAASRSGQPAAGGRAGAGGQPKDDQQHPLTTAPGLPGRPDCLSRAEGWASWAPPAVASRPSRRPTTFAAGHSASLPARNARRGPARAWLEDPGRGAARRSTTATNRPRRVRSPRVRDRARRARRAWSASRRNSSWRALATPSQAGGITSSSPPGGDGRNGRALWLEGPLGLAGQGERPHAWARREPSSWLFLPGRRAAGSA